MTDSNKSSDDKGTDGEIGEDRVPAQDAAVVQALRRGYAFLASIVDASIGQCGPAVTASVTWAATEFGRSAAGFAVNLYAPWIMAATLNGKDFWAPPLVGVPDSIDEWRTTLLWLLDADAKVVDDTRRGHLRAFADYIAGNLTPVDDDSGASAVSGDTEQTCVALGVTADDLREVISWLMRVGFIEGVDVADLGERRAGVLDAINASAGAVHTPMRFTVPEPGMLQAVEHIDVIRRLTHEHADPGARHINPGAGEADPRHPTRAYSPPARHMVSPAGIAALRQLAVDAMDYYDAQDTRTRAAYLEYFAAVTGNAKLALLEDGDDGDDPATCSGHLILMERDPTTESPDRLVLRIEDTKVGAIVGRDMAAAIAEADSDEAARAEFLADIAREFVDPRGLVVLPDGWLWRPSPDVVAVATGYCPGSPAVDPSA